MTQQEVVAHPYWQKFQARLPVVINSLVQRGMISPNVQNVLVNIIRNSYPMMHQFIENLNMRYSELTDQQLDAEIFQWIQPAANQAIAQVRQMTGGFGVGFGGAGAGFGGGGFGMRQPVGFGYDSGRQVMPSGTMPGGIPVSPFSGGQNPDPFRPDNPTSMFGGTPKPQTQREKHIEDQMKPKVEQPPAPIKWEKPVIEGEKNVELTNVTAQITKYTLCTGDRAIRVIVHDSKVGYTSDYDALNRYKGIFSMFSDPRRKFLTVVYQQLKLIDVGKDEFSKLVNSVATAVSKAQNIEGKLRAIISTSSGFSVAAYDAFNKLFLDELQFHIECGELCDSPHPKNILNRPAKIEQVLAWLTGDIDKGMLSAMRGMKGFEDRLNTLLRVIIDGIVATLPRRILDASRDMTLLDDFYRAIPGIWTDDCGETFKNTNDLVDIFLATRETVDGSKSSGAVKADSILKETLNELSKHFTLIFVPRVASWCNYSKADVCRYDPTGNCQPTVFSPLQPRNDVEFFVNESLDKFTNSKDQVARWTPKNIYLELDEETYCLQYGRTTDDVSYVCTSRYWH